MYGILFSYTCTLALIVISLVAFLNIYVYGSRTWLELKQQPVSCDPKTLRTRSHLINVRQLPE